MAERLVNSGIPRKGPWVRWRETGHLLKPETDLLRFEVADINRIIKSAAATADQYGSLIARGGGDPTYQALVLSCYALTDQWTPERLAEGWGFREYRTARADRLLENGFDLWPTECYLDGEPYPTNEVHYDLVVATGPSLVSRTISTGTPAERRTAREALEPLFRKVLGFLGDPRPLEI
ncbi:MAG: hypothetical protein ACP5PB_06270 [Acidimicrobiales bacterium]